ncbi:MAG TPA: C40 family peptidase [Lacibacter sp.]|nr:C40 family peptidase [Lacibacter sp.]HMO87742.1 C40 family peptidase [Lacibacter sp.]HMP85670.1 C40 family peptidase [Lacibacter sp.]
MSLDTALCIVPVCPIRQDARHEQELTSQLLFGEAVEIVSAAGEWVEVRCLYDGYTGWCMANQLERVPKALAVQAPQQLVSDWVEEVEVNGEPMHIPYGSVLRGLEQGRAAWGSICIGYTGTALTAAPLAFTPENIRSVSAVYRNSPYLWGGRSVFGVDCSGFVQTVFRFFGKWLPRDASLQAGCGSDAGFLEEARCGDLAFFDNEEGRIVHVGLLLGDGDILHAAGKVRLDRLDHAGILHSTSGQRTHRLRMIRRY